MKKVSVGYNPQWGVDATVDSKLAELMANNNFSMWHTGGGCMAWQRDHDDGGYLMITDEGGADLGTWKDRNKKAWVIGRYNEEGDEWVCCTEITLAEALALADIIPQPGAGKPEFCDKHGNFKVEG